MSLSRSFAVSWFDDLVAQPRQHEETESVEREKLASERPRQDSNLRPAA